MAKFNVEVRAEDGSAGDVLQVEAVSAEAAVEFAARMVTKMDGDWEVIGVVS